MSTRLTRAEVPEAETWRLEDLFPTAQDWEREAAAFEGAIPELNRHRERPGEGAGALLECLEARERLVERLVRLEAYANLRMAEDGTSPANQALAGLIIGVSAKVEGALAGIRSAILQLPGGTVERYLETEPGLAAYRLFLGEILADKAHALTPEGEQVIAALSEALSVPPVLYQRTTSADMRFDPATDSRGQEVPVSLTSFMMRIEVSPDTQLRRSAYASLVNGLKPYQHTLALTLASEIRKNVALARLRGYRNTAQMLLQECPPHPLMTPHGVTVEAYENVLNVIQAELAPHMRRYARLRRRVLGLDRLLMCDIKAPLDPEFDPKVSFGQAQELIQGAVAVMGPEYGEIIRQAFDERWIDRADNLGKAGGAFAHTVYGAHPYVLSPWFGGLYETFVLAHELGHAAHGELSNRSQRVVNARVSPFFIEAPSTLNEQLLAEHIQRTSGDPRLNRWVTMYLLSSYHHNFITHLLEGELLRRLYTLAEEGDPLTTETIARQKAEILAGFWGDTVAIDEGARLTWMRQPHYYMGLYPYTYTAGLAASTLVAGSIREEGEPAARRWLEVLKAGSSRGPLELFRMAGVDMTTAEPLRRAVARVGVLVDGLDRSFA